MALEAPATAAPEGLFTPVPAGHAMPAPEGLCITGRAGPCILARVGPSIAARVVLVTKGREALATEALAPMKNALGFVASQKPTLNIKRLEPSLVFRTGFRKNERSFL